MVLRSLQMNHLYLHLIRLKLNFNCLLKFILIEWYNKCIVVGFFHSILYLWISFMLLYIAVADSFSLLENFPFYKLLQLIYAFYHWWIFRLLPDWCYYRKFYSELTYICSFVICACISIGNTPRSGISVSQLYIDSILEVNKFLKVVTSFYIPKCL